MSEPKSTEDIARIMHDVNERTKATEIERLAALRNADVIAPGLPDGIALADFIVDDGEPVDIDDMDDAAVRAEDAGWRRALVTHEADVGYYIVATRPKQIRKLIAELRKLRVQSSNSRE